MKTNLMFIFLVATTLLSGCGRKYPLFTEKTLDSTIVKDCWTKSIGDLNSDGVNDLIIGGHVSGGIWAYLSPDFRKVQITERIGASTDAEVADVDNDGDNDMVAVFDNDISWFSNPGWEIHTVRDSLETHDIVVADFDGDHLTDIAARNQGEFGRSGEKIFILKQADPDTWSYSEIAIRDGEGLEIADLNNDKKSDLVINGSWLENTGDLSNWIEHIFTETWSWKNAFICCIDINNDGRTDIAMSPSELNGTRYRISWFEAPEIRTGIWKEHVVIPDIETVVHFIGGADFNMDGRADLTYAMMTQGADPDEVVILFNLENNEWKKEVISTGGSHSMRIGDIDSDGDPDLFGANWNDDIVRIWLNQLK